MQILTTSISGPHLIQQPWLAIPLLVPVFLALVLILHDLLLEDRSEEQLQLHPRAGMEFHDRLCPFVALIALRLQCQALEAEPSQVARRELLAGSPCNETFQTVTKVKLTATANPDSIFKGWSGGGYTGTKPCQVTVNSAITITANFDKKVPHISVSGNSLDFGSVKMGKSLKKTLKIMNSGTGDLTVSIGGVAGTDFSVVGSTSVTVKPNKSYSLGITFKPSSKGNETGTLVLTTNDPTAATIKHLINWNGHVAIDYREEAGAKCSCLLVSVDMSP